MDYRFVDCRPRDAYLAGHVPGAAHADPETDLTGTDGGGRHPLPTAEAFAAWASLAGIGPDTLVVAYDEGTGWAARLWWLLRHFGHDAAAVIRLDAWHGPLSTEHEPIEPRGIRGPPANRRRRPLAGAPRAARAIRRSRSSTPAHLNAGAARSSRSIRSPGGFRAPATASSRTSRRCRRTCSTRTSSSSTAARASRPAPSSTSSTSQDVTDARLYPGSWSEWYAIGPVETG